MVSKSLLLLIMTCLVSLSMADFHTDVNHLFGHVDFSNDGKQADLFLDQFSGSGFQSKNTFIFGKFDIRMKLIPGRSAGTVTTFYLNSTMGTWHDEIDFEFLGHLDSRRYILQTNVITPNLPHREQRIHLWFDPSVEFHKYSILWNPHELTFYVDNVPIRVFKTGKTGVPYPSQQPMTLYGTLWDGSNWATEGGSITVNWNQGPFHASYRDYINVHACIWLGNGRSTHCHNPNAPWMTHTLDQKEQQMLAWVRKNYLIYDYCTDPATHNPPECSVGLLQ